MMSLKKIFRNKSTDILFMMGLMISCVILINISNLISKISIEESDSKNYEYEQFYLLSESDDNISKILTQILDNEQKANIYQSTLVNIDKQSDEKKANMVMQINEKLLFDLKKGKYDEERDYKNAVIIGENLEKFTFVESGEKYINLNDSKYNVIGFLQNNAAGGIDNSIYIFWDTLSNEIKDKYMSGEMLSFNDFSINTNDEKVLWEVENSVKEKLSEINVSAERIEKKNKGDYQNQWYKSYNQILFGIAFLFSIITCFSVSYFWLVNRKRELAVRIAFGYSRFMIFCLLLVDVFRLMIPTFFITLGIQAFINVFMKNNVFVAETIMLQVVVVFVGILSIILINTLYMMEKLKKMDLSMKE